MIPPQRIFLSDYAGHALTVQLARSLAHQGHDVTYVYFAASTETPKGEMAKRPGDPSSLRMIGIGGGARLIKSSFIQRRNQDMQFARGGAEVVATFKPQIVLSACSPPEVNLTLQRAARKVGAVFINWMQDIWSIAAKVAFQSRSPLLAPAIALVLRQMEKRLVRLSDANIFICDEFKDLAIGWGAPPDTATVIPNWGVIEDMPMRPKDNVWAREYDLHDKVCVLYSGTLGLKHNPDLLADLAVAVRDRPDVRVVVVSEGDGARRLCERKRAEGLDNLVLLPYQPFGRYPDVLGAGDVLVALLVAEADSYCVPSKVLAYLCAGRALLLSVPMSNPAAKMIDDSGSGRFARPGDTDQFISSAKALIDDPQTRLALGAAGRQYADQTFSLVNVTARFEQVFSVTLARAARQ